MPFCGTATVIESRHWIHPISGRQFSPYSSYVEPGSELVATGFDIAWSGDGTVGRCKAPFKTREEAQAFADKWNADRAAAYARAPAFSYSVATRELLVARNPDCFATFYYVALSGEIPASATRYKTRAGAERAIARRLAARAKRESAS